MRATSVKQIKFNRGQVSDLLSERVDMGLQNACGTRYDNIYVNRYGQLQNAPVPMLASETPYNAELVCMFDSGEDLVYPVTMELNQAQTDSIIKVYKPVSKSNQYQQTDFSAPIASGTAEGIIQSGYKTYQFGYNILFFGQNKKPWLMNILPQHTSWDNSITVNIKPDYFDGAFKNIFVRGLNIETPADFTVPTSGTYIIGDGQKQVTTKLIVKVQRNNAGGSFTQSLVGQVIQSPANGGALQVRSVEDGDNLTAYVLSPLTALSASATDIRIPWNSVQTRMPSPATPNYTGDSARWVFGYESAYGEDVGPNGTPSYPDSAIYVNQRLIFGGNDYHGSLISASRIGVVNDFDPESATESDAFTTAIAAKDFCRVVDFVVSNNELRIACTNGEYAMSLASLTPSGSLNGFDLRSEVGIAKDTPICDCGGLTAYISNDRGSVYGTQFSLLRDRYQPISLTSQTSNMVIQTTQLEYLKNRPNNEGNCLVGKNGDYSIFVGALDLNAGLIGLSKIKRFGQNDLLSANHDLYVTKLFVAGSALWAEVSTTYTVPATFTNKLLARFTFGEMFAFPTWYRYYAPGSIVPGTETHPNEMVIPNALYNGIIDQYPDLLFRALYKDGNNYKIIEPTGFTYNDSDNTRTVEFAEDIVQSNIVCAGFIRQADWRSVEIGVGMATREINKRIVKLEGVIEPTQVTGNWRFKGLVLTPAESKDFITLTRSKDVETMDVDNLANTSYTEDKDIVWRRAFDNPDRELHWGVSMVAPFLVKSLTAVVEYDEIC